MLATVRNLGGISRRSILPSSERHINHRGCIMENERQGDHIGGWGPVRPLVIWAKDGGGLNKGSHWAKLKDSGKDSQCCQVLENDLM